MKIRVSSLGLAFVLAGMSAVHAGKAGEPEKILMVGNSLTSTYELPKMLLGLAESKGKALQVDTQIGGGRNLLWHLEEGPKGKPVAEKIATGGYDTVVVQDGSRGLLKAGGPEKLAAAVEKFDELTRAAEVRMVLYSGFVRSPNPSADDVARMMEACTVQAQKYKVSCAPVALAFQQFLAINGEVALLDNEQGKRYALDKTGTHQSPFGSYLAACVIYSALYNQSPEGSSYRKLPNGTEISEEDAALAQKVAWETWSEYKPSLESGN